MWWSYHEVDANDEHVCYVEFLGVLLEPIVHQPPVDVKPASGPAIAKRHQTEEEVAVPTVSGANFSF